jgi:hypothetical protein
MASNGARRSTSVGAISTSTNANIWTQRSYSTTHRPIEREIVGFGDRQTARNHFHAQNSIATTQTKQIQ